VSRTNSFIRDSLLPHVAGGALGGLVLGTALAATAAVAQALVPAQVLAQAVTGLVLAYAIGEFAGRPFPRWSASRQVPRDFQRTRYHRTTALLWGADLGFGWSTKQPTSALLMTGSAALVAGAEVALLTGAVFGVVRALTLVLVVGGTDRDSIERRFEWMLRHPRGARVGTGVAGASLVAVLATAVL